MPSSILQDIFIAIRTDNPGNTTPVGTGTWNDPYGGPADSGTWFDYTMKNYVGANQTVRIGPGVFRTAGNPGNSAGAWDAQSGMRLLGSGINSTTLKLVSPGGARAAISMNYGSATTYALAGFEASDFTIDCAFTNVAGAANTGVALYGKNILLHRLRVINFGGNTGTAIGVLNLATVYSENCVIEECIVESPAAIGSTTQCVLFYFWGQHANPHDFCVIRNCIGRGSNDPGLPTISANIHGIFPGAGRGTILEGNQILNAASGVTDLGVYDSSVDLIIRDCYFRNVSKGLNFNRSTSPVIGRIIATNNIFDIGTSLTGPTGINLLSTTGSNIVYSTVILRKNIIRDAAWDSVPPPTSVVTGITVSSVSDLNVESNLINNSPSGSRIVYANCTHVRTFNNETTAGVAIPP